MVTNLKECEQIITDIDKSLSKCFRKKLHWDEVQNEIEQNIERITESGLIVFIQTVCKEIPRRKLNKLKRHAKIGVGKISFYYFLNLPEFLFRPTESEVHKFLNDLAGQLAFCLSVRTFFIYVEKGKVVRKDVQKLVEKYLRFSSGKALRVALSWGSETARRNGLTPLVDYARLIRGWKTYVLNREKILQWKYELMLEDLAGNVNNVIIITQPFGRIRKPHHVSIRNLEKSPRYWDWSCNCEDYLFQRNRNILVLCLHVAAVLWKLMDEGKLKPIKEIAKYPSS